MCNGLPPVGQPRFCSHAHLKTIHTTFIIVELSTTRLQLRPFFETDLTPTYLGWLKDPLVTRFSNQRFNTHTLESCYSYFKSFTNSNNSFLLIEHQKDATAIGTLTLYRHPFHGTADIGLMIGHRSYWRQGLGLEAWQGVLDRLLNETGIRKVTGGTARPNVGMVKIMEKSGMVLEAIRRHHEVIEGEDVDLLYYARFSQNLG